MRSSRTWSSLLVSGVIYRQFAPAILESVVRLDNRLGDALVDLDKRVIVQNLDLADIVALNAVQLRKKCDEVLWIHPAIFPDADEEGLLVLRHEIPRLLARSLLSRSSRLFALALPRCLKRATFGEHFYQICGEIRSRKDRDVFFDKPFVRVKLVRIGILVNKTYHFRHFASEDIGIFDVSVFLGVHKESPFIFGYAVTELRRSPTPDRKPCQYRSIDLSGRYDENLRRPVGFRYDKTEIRRKLQLLRVGYTRHETFQPREIQIVSPNTIYDTLRTHGTHGRIKLVGARSEEQSGRRRIDVQAPAFRSVVR